LPGPSKAKVELGHAVPVSDLNIKESIMTIKLSLVIPTVATVALLALGACAGMTEQERATAIGAGAGAVGGAILTGGSTMGTVGGAAVGGIIGHETNKR
jgi:osmotically inducible lipoprotein OsmB